jgi:hypothetical protein
MYCSVVLMIPRLCALLSLLHGRLADVRESPEGFAIRQTENIHKKDRP